MPGDPAKGWYSESPKKSNGNGDKKGGWCGFVALAPVLLAVALIGLVLL